MTHEKIQMAAPHHDPHAGERHYFVIEFQSDEIGRMGYEADIWLAWDEGHALNLFHGWMAVWQRRYHSVTIRPATAAEAYVSRYCVHPFPNGITQE